ncbi:hypothetical protein [Sciscionella sediminilitoris]|uniref:hypothetical protein n=1 Tax=Sciscionella sediminilitoris TaxID=1445613 RepID=UPI0004DEFF90|nr:hypothetical protein [Sciscionella sp. SE31]
MAENRHALVLHFSGVAEPMLIELGEELSGELPDKLAAKLLAGEIETITAANDARIVVNFSHVVAAHVDIAPPLGQIYGSPSRR